jgi:methionyl-tRNA synthetase
MEIVCLSSTKDAILAKAVADLLTDKPTVLEEDQRAPYAFSIYPVLKIGGVPRYFGLRAIIKFLFAATLPPATLSTVDSLIALADSIFSAAIPIIVKKLTILIKDIVLQTSQATVSKLIAAAQPLLALGSNVGVVYFTAVLSIVSSFGIDISPASAPPVDVSALSDEAVTFAREVLNIPARYEMSPPPSKPMFFTTPIYYVNGLPHLGHVFTTTLVEALAKWYKLRQIPMLYSSGTDEHGLKVQTTAAANGVAPIEWCDRTVQTFRAAFEDFDIHPDVFIRTTEPRHLRIATVLWEVLTEKGYIYKGTYDGWYSKTEECFVPDNQVKEVVVGGVTKHVNSADNAELIWSSETNYMFKLESMQQRLLDWLDANPTAIVPRCYYNAVRAQVVAGLHDLSISRQTVTWGVPVPGDPSQVMYVWIDALANYLTVAGWDRDTNGIWPADLHTVGKDILRFHGIFWPAFLIAAGVEPYKRLLVHGWWTMGAQKMSKSIGNVLDPVKMRDFWGLEAVKYFLLREVTLNSDSDYSDEAMLNRHNKDLGDVLGNFVMRILSKTLNPSLTVPAFGEWTPEDLALIEDAETLPGTVDHNVAFGKTRVALQEIWDVLRDQNKYLTDQAPWAIRDNPERRVTVMYVLYEVLRITMLCLWPFMSQTATTILRALGAPEILENDKDKMFKFGLLAPGTQLSTVPPLFPRKVIED